MTTMLLRRIELQFYKDHTTGDNTQVPAAGATYTLFRQGATVKANTAFTTTSTWVVVPVHDRGGVRVGDSLQLASNPAVLFTVHAVTLDDTNGWQLKLFPQTEYWNLSVGDRLIPTNEPFPSLFADTSGTVPLGSSTVTLDGNGRASFFCRDRLYDAVLSGAGATRLVLDAEGGALATSLGWVSVFDHFSVQEAVDSCPVGGTVHVPTGEHPVGPGGLVIRRTISLRGETGSRLIAHAAAADEPVIRLAPGGQVLSDVEIRNLVLTNPTVPSSRLAGNHGLVCDVPSDGSKVVGLTLDRVRVVNMGDDGIRLNANQTNDSFFVFVTCRRVECTLNHGHGLFLRYGTVATFNDCFFNANDYSGLYAAFSELALRSCAFESNCKVALPEHPEFGGQARVDTCVQARFDACRFEQFTQNHEQYPTEDAFTQTPKRGLAIFNSPGASVTNCFFRNKVNNTHDADARGIYVSYGTDISGPDQVGAGVQASVFYGNVYSNVVTAMEIDGTNNPALDCVVFPHHATPGSGVMILPLDVPNFGLMLLGGRAAPEASTPKVPKAIRGLRGLSVQRITDASELVQLGPEDAGRLVIDMTLSVPRLKVWDGNGWQLP